MAETNYEYYAEKLNDKQSVINETNSKIDELQSKLDDLNNQRKSSQTIDSKLEKEILNTRNEINKLKNLIAETSEGMSTLTQGVKSSLETMKSYTGEDTRKLAIAQELLSSELNVKQNQLDSVKLLIEVLEKQESKLKSNNSSEVESISNDIKALKEQSTKLETEIENVQKMIDKNNTILAEKVDNLVSFKDEDAKFDVDLDTDTDSDSVLKDAGQEVIDSIKDAIKDELKDDDDSSSSEIVDSSTTEEVVNASKPIGELLDESIKLDESIQEAVINFGTNNENKSSDSTSTSEETSSSSFSSMTSSDVLDFFNDTSMTNEEFVSNLEKLAQSGTDNIYSFYKIIANRCGKSIPGLGGVLDIPKSTIAISNPSVAAAYLFFFLAAPSELNNMISNMSEANIKKAIALMNVNSRNLNIIPLLQALTVENIGKVSSALGGNIYTHLSSS